MTNMCRAYPIKWQCGHMGFHPKCCGGQVGEDPYNCPATWGQRIRSLSVILRFKIWQTAPFGLYHGHANTARVTGGSQASPSAYRGRTKTVTSAKLTGNLHSERIHDFFRKPSPLSFEVMKHRGKARGPWAPSIIMNCLLLCGPKHVFCAYCSPSLPTTTTMSIEMLTPLRVSSTALLKASLYS